MGCDINFFSANRVTSDKNYPFAFLHAHEIQYVVALVQNQIKLDVHLKTQLVLSVPVMLTLWIVFRKVFRIIHNNPCSSICDTFFDTWGTFLATHCSIRINNRPERIMHLSILLLSVLITNIFTAILFNYLMANELQYGIDSLNGITDHNITLTFNEIISVTHAHFIRNYR